MDRGTGCFHLHMDAVWAVQPCAATQRCSFTACDRSHHQWDYAAGLTGQLLPMCPHRAMAWPEIPTDIAHHDVNGRLFL